MGTKLPSDSVSGSTSKPKTHVGMPLCYLDPYELNLRAIHLASPADSLPLSLFASCQLCCNTEREREAKHKQSKKQRQREEERVETEDSLNEETKDRKKNNPLGLNSIASSFLRFYSSLIKHLITRFRTLIN